MIKIKRFFRNASIGFHMLFIFFCILSLIGAAWIYVNVSQLLFYMLLVVIACLFIFDGYYAIHKTAENYLIKYDRACFDEIKKFLCNEYIRIYIFSSSNMDKSLEYYGKIDRDNTILVYGQDKYGKRAYQHWDDDYVWFMENFYVM